MEIMSKRIGIALLLAMASNGALAAWKQVGSNENTTLYIDPSSLQREGNLAKMWHLTDYRKSTRDISEPYLSAKTSMNTTASRQN